MERTSREVTSDLEMFDNRLRALGYPTLWGVGRTIAGAQVAFYAGSITPAP